MANDRTNGRQTNKKGYYVFDKQKILGFKEDKSHDQFARQLGISRQSVISIYNCVNEFALVHEETALKITENLGIDIKYFIYRRPLPNKPEFYSDINFGYFIDNVQEHDPKEPSAPNWFSESISLKFDGHENDRIRFVGEIYNCCKNRFRVRAERMSDFIFCILSDNDDHSLSFVGIANNMYN